MQPSAGGGAYNATVETGPPMSPRRGARTSGPAAHVAIQEVEKAITVIEEKVSGVDLASVEDPEKAAQRLKGMRQSLAAARDELARLRVEDGDN
jgi:hypothetical protein